MSSKFGKIVFVNQATGYLTIDIINEFAKKFEEIALIAGSIRVQDTPLNDKVSWSKIIKYNRGNPLQKFISWVAGTLQIFYLLITKYRRYEIFYITIPPLVYLLSLILPNRYSILIFDVFPDALKSYNVRENNPIYKLWKRWNQKLFRDAYRVYTLGKSMAGNLKEYMDIQNLIIIPNWSGLTNAQPVRKGDNLFIQKNGYKNKFIVQYSGNIGYTHNVEILIDVARMIQSEEDIKFLIIGRGERVDYIRDLIHKYNLSNCDLLPFQPDDMLKYSLSAADFGVVILDDDAGNVSIPSKIYNYQTLGIPLLCIAPATSELNRHVNYYKNGRCFQKEDIDDIVNFIKETRDSKKELKRMADNSLRASTEFSNKNSKKYLNAYVR